MRMESRAVNRGKLAVVKCSSRKRIIIPGNSSLEVPGRIDKRVLSTAGMGVPELLEGSSLPEVLV